ncbi:MAG: hydrogenase maturation protease [Deltaproteobacteria bacterium]|nr:hydrogenase maturation protease [Deltaproteobacteria bacterium]
MENNNLVSKTAVIGIGNSILSDDSVGIKAVKALESMYKAARGSQTYEGCRKVGVRYDVGTGINKSNQEDRDNLDNHDIRSNKSRYIGGYASRTGTAEFIEVSSGGINLMEYMAGFNRAVIIDAIVTGKHKAGTVLKFIYPDIPFTKNTVSTHDIDLPAALEVGRYLGISLPSEIIIFAVEAKDTVNFSEKLTEDVENAFVGLVEEIKLMLNF